MPHQIRTATADDAGPACAVLHASITHCCVDDHHGDPAAVDAWLCNRTPAQVRAWILSPPTMPSRPSRAVGQAAGTTPIPPGSPTP
ncbi:hypothetical protein LJR039_005310 [Pseudorhodoferax sp. LjRoot39]|uniref:hypothetical protein n=1 Tax=Pseudorhodoferax sp. LjRoot39 TaxID=3342328 RepID=UPI003ECCAAF1